MKRVATLVLALIMALPHAALATTLYWATDLHYLSPSLYDDADKLQRMEIKGDGRLITQSAALTDAFFDIVLTQKPDALILSGDLTYNGEMQSHLDIAEKLKVLDDAGIAVLVIPGNHDINTRSGYAYMKSGTVPTPEIDLAGFYGLYSPFAFDHAILKAPNSYSYLYAVTDDLYVMMIEGGRFSPQANIGAFLVQSTREFILEGLALAQQNGAKVITVSHQNLFEHSPLFTNDFIMEKGESLYQAMEAYGMPLHLSGHMHIMHQATRGSVTEMLLSALPMTPCRYGIIDVEGGAFSLRTEPVADYARQAYDLFYGQTYRSLMSKLSYTDIAQDVQQTLSDYCARVYCAYFAGNVSQALLDEPAHALYTEYAKDNATLARLSFLFSDAGHDMQSLVITN